MSLSSGTAAIESRFFPDASGGMAEIKLDYAFDSGLEIALLIGEPGVGKTTVLRRFAGRIETAGHIVVDVFFPQLQADDLVAFIDGELGAPYNLVEEDRHVPLRRIARRARQLGREKRAIVVMIDDAHLMTDRNVLETLQSLLNLRDREAVRLMLVLAGEKTLLTNLARVPALAGCVGVTALISPLDLDEAETYIRQRFQVDGKPAATFSKDVIERMYRETAGIPRSLNRMAEMAMLLARSAGRGNVTLGDLESLASEIGIRAGAT